MWWRWSRCWFRHQRWCWEARPYFLFQSILKRVDFFVQTAWWDPKLIPINVTESDNIRCIVLKIINATACARDGSFDRNGVGSACPSFKWFVLGQNRGSVPNFFFKRLWRAFFLCDQDVKHRWSGLRLVTQVFSRHTWACFDGIDEHENEKSDEECHGVVVANFRMTAYQRKLDLRSGGSVRSSVVSVHSITSWAV